METLARYIEVGDEVRCLAVREDGLPRLVYTEEEEDGSMAQVEIQPGWLAK
jgi:hypothetical protein